MVFFSQFVFALTEPGGDALGGRLWYSNGYGMQGTWSDITDKLIGEILAPVGSCW